MSLFTGLMPKVDSGQAKVMVNMKDGIFVSSNSSVSMKEGVLMGGVGMMAVLGTTSYQYMKPRSSFDYVEPMEEAPQGEAAE